MFELVSGPLHVSRHGVVPVIAKCLRRSSHRLGDGANAIGRPILLRRQLRSRAFANAIHEAAVTVGAAAR
jgi:hypothetical protein